MLEGKREKYKTSIIVAAFFSFTLLFFVPMNLYINNIAEYTVQSWEIGLYACSIALIGTVALSVLAGIFNNKLHQILTVIYAAFGILIWLEANFVPWKLGAFDGRNVNWNEIPFYYYLDILIWVIVLGIGLWKRAHFYRMARIISSALIITQLIVLAAGFYLAPSKPQASKYVIDYAKQFEFSRNKNVILLVMDGMQTDVFQELLNEDDYYKKQFENFTYFRDALSGFNVTSLSMPVFLTGQFYDKSVPLNQYLQTSYRNSLLSLLKQNDFDVRVFPSYKFTLLYEDTVFDNFKPRKYFDYVFEYEKRSLFTDILHLKVSPYSIKRLLLYEPNSDNTAISNEKRTEPNLDFIKKFKENVKVTSEEPVFRYYHVHGVHPPLGIDRNLQPVQAEYNRENYKEQYRGVLKIVDEFLQDLKDQGIYDNSLIIVMGDHGSWISEFNQQAANLGDEENKEHRYMMAGVHPTLLIKRIHSQEPFKVSDAPVSLADIPRTIAQELSIPNNFPGESIFEIKENQKRERITYHGVLESGLKTTTFKKFIVDGNSWLYGSWRLTSIKE